MSDCHAGAFLTLAEVMLVNVKARNAKIVMEFFLFIVPSFAVFTTDEDAQCDHADY